MKAQNTVDLQVKVSPKASRNAVGVWKDGVLKLSVTAVPEKGKANVAVIALLSDWLRLPKSSIEVVRGQTATTKQLRLSGISADELAQKLAGQQALER